MEIVLQLLAFITFQIVSNCEYKEHYSNGNVYVCHSVEVKVSEQQLQNMATQFKLDL